MSLTVENLGGVSRRKAKEEPLYNAKGVALCGAKNRQGGRCRAYPLANGRCHYHGGKSLSGPAHPHYKTGRYSKVLPLRLAARFQASMEDPASANLSAELALIDARQEELLGKLDTGEAGAMWKALRATYAALEQARDARDIPNLLDQLGVLGGVIQRGAAEFLLWNEIIGLVEQRRRVAESQVKNMTSLQNTLTTGEAIQLVAQVVGILQKQVMEHVADESVQRRVISGVAQELRLLDTVAGGG